MSPRETRKFTAVLFGIAFAALAVRTVPIVSRGDIGWAMEPNGDSAAYIGLADGLKRGCGFAWWAGDHCADLPESNRTPGYPVFLSLMPGLRFALIAQGLLWSCLCFFVGLFAAIVAGSSAGYCAAAIIAADVPSIVSSGEIMSETLFTALLVGAVLAELEMLRSTSSSMKVYCLLAFASSMLGLALLVRPIAEFVIPLFIVPPMLLTGLSRSRRALLSLLVAVGPVVSGTAWSLRNYSLAGVSGLSTIGGLNFFYYRAVGTLALASHAGWAATLARTQPPPHSELGAQACQIILHHPLAFIAMTLWSFFYVCAVPDRAPLAHLLGIPSLLQVHEPGSVRIEALAHKLWAGKFSGLSLVPVQELHSSVVLLLLVVLQLAMIGFTWAGVMRSLKKHAGHSSSLRASILFALAVAVLMLLLASGPEAAARFRVPATPLLAFFAGVGWFGTAEG